MVWRRLVVGLVDFAARRPRIVLAATAVFFLASLLYARHLELRTEFVELLPRDSPAFRAFEHQLGRVSGGATFFVGIDSPDPRANERAVDDLTALLNDEIDRHAACAAKCAGNASCELPCGPDDVAYVESGTKDTKAFFEKTKWVYADLQDLKDADHEVDKQIAIRSGIVSDLDDTPSSADAGARAPSEKKAALGLDSYDARWQAAARKHDDFPTGYFANDEGTFMVVRLVANASGTGGASGDRLLAAMTRRIADMHVTSRYHPAMQIGFAGDIPNAVAEKDSILSEAVGATVTAFVLIIGGIVFYYRSFWSLIIIAVPAILGVTAAYAFATAVFGYVNLPGAFLGAIILGNGINYPIVLFSRYREFRARGMAKDVARREAVLNAFRTELVGACVAAIAYGSLTVTQFRGFSQFGWIGFVGMLLVWISIVPVVPALIVVTESMQMRVYGRELAPSIRSDGSSGPAIRLLAFVTGRFSIPIVIAGALVTAAAAFQLPRYLRDPWEYDFSQLESRESKSAGPGAWSNRVDSVFRGKQNISGVRILADDVGQVPQIKATILSRDAADAEGPLIDDIVTIWDFLPGTPAEQEAKLDVLASIRDRLSPGVIFDLPADEQKRVMAMRPPDDLTVVKASDLPPLIRRRFQENDGRIGTPMYVKYKFGVSFSNGHTLLRMAKTTDNVKLDNGSVVQTASRSTIFAEMIRSMSRDGPLATGTSFLAVVCVVIVATRTRIGAFSVLLSLAMGVTCLVGFAAIFHTKLNFLNFIALPITFGIGCEYPFNVYDRVRLLGGDISAALSRTGGAVALCSYTTAVGYASMLLSDSGAIRSFGRLAMFGELSCVTMALLFLPALLHWITGKPPVSAGPIAP